MKSFKKYWTIIPLFLFGYLFIRSFIINYEEGFIFDFEILIILGILFLVFFIITIYKGLKYFRKSNKRFELFPIFLCFIFVIVFSGILFKYERIDSSPIVLRANYDGDINGFSLEFRKDGTYKFFNYTVLGGKYLRGKYLIKDSIIILDKNNVDNVIKTNQLAIRSRPEDFNRKITKIVQLDKNHKYIEGQYFDFIINVDNR